MRLLFLLLLCTNVFAQEINLGIGQAIYEDRGNGIWFQNGFSHTRELKKMDLQATMSDKMTNNLNYDVGYIYLGTARVNSADTPSDTNYNSYKGGCNGKCWPLSNFIGSGHSEGFTFDLAPYVDVDKIRFTVYIGTYVNRGTWKETALNWVATPNGTPINLHADAIPEWKVQGNIGFGVRYGNMSFRYGYYKNPTGKLPDTISIWKATNSFTINYSF
jgi:hypothetical protein